MEGTERAEKAGWYILGLEKNAVIFSSNAHELYRIPIDLLDIIVNLKNFDGQIGDEGRFVTYAKDGRILCRVPKGLIRSLIENEESSEEGVAGWS